MHNGQYSSMVEFFDAIGRSDMYWSHYLQKSQFGSTPEIAREFYRLCQEQHYKDMDINIGLIVDFTKRTGLTYPKQEVDGIEIR